MRNSGNPTTQALKLLMQDHRRIRKLVAQAERARRSPAALAQAVLIACREIADHATLEERFFYPAVRAASPRAQVVEAQIAHAIVANLAADLAAMPCDDERYLPTFRVLSAQLEQHIAAEEDALFERAAASRADLRPLLAAFAERQRNGGITDVDVEIAGLLHDPGGGRVRSRSGRDPQRVRDPGRRGAH
jgi:hypothetical protein